MRRTILSVLIFVNAALAVESEPVRPGRVVDGMTLRMSADLMGVQIPVYVRLAGIAVPDQQKSVESARLSQWALKGILSTSRQSGELRRVIVTSIGAHLEDDNKGRVLAIVSFPKLPPPSSMYREDGADKNRADTLSSDMDLVRSEESFQEYMVRAGWAVVDKKVTLPSPLQERLAALQQAASDANAGLWKDYRTVMESLARE